MSLSPMPYPPGFQAPSLDVQTPPPPPPKPNSHETSRRGTPQTGAPLPFPYSSSLPREGPQWQAGGESTGGNPETFRDDPDASGSQLQAPSIDDGWIPDILKDKSTVDLQTILSNPILLNAVANVHPAHSASQARLHSLLTSNKALANHVLELESHLASLRASTESLLLQHQSLELSWRKKQTEMDAALAPWSPKALYQRLVSAVAEQEAICRAVEESFLEGENQHGRASDRDVADWVRRVRAEGAKLEARREARARWDEGRVGGWR